MMSGSSSETQPAANTTGNMPSDPTNQAIGFGEFQSATTAAGVNQHSSQNGVNYAQVAAPKQEMVYNYVELDATAVADCYSLPKSADISLAVRRTFGDCDEYLRIFAPRRNYPGIWKVETENIEAFKGVSELKTSEDGPVIAKVTVKSERVMVKEGKLHRQQVKNPNDLLITLRDADSLLYKHVSNEDLLQEIIKMGVGSVKRAPQRQFDRKTGDPTGHKYFILENVPPEERKKVPAAFDFYHPQIGMMKMWLSHRYQIRKCWFCGDKHDAICPTRELMMTLQQEREAFKAQNNGMLEVKTYSDSTLRYANQVALASDIDSMPGATLGNLMNAIGVDQNNATIPNVVLVAGANERRSNLPVPEYLYSLQKIRQRVTELASKKNVAIIPPPKLEEEFITPEETVIQEKFEEHLKELSETGALIWDNPIDSYEEDMGKHPSPEQTVTLMKHIHQKSREVWGKPFILPSADDRTLKTNTRYHHVQSLYKYGCGACNEKIQNKWFNICDSCKHSAAVDVTIQDQSKEVTQEIEARLKKEMPPLGSDSEDELKCDECGVLFAELRDLTTHFEEIHPESTRKFKRGKSDKSYDKKGRRVKNVPSKSL